MTWRRHGQKGQFIFPWLSTTNKLVVNQRRQGWLPWKDVAKLRLEAKRRYKIRLEWTKDQGMETVQLLWKTPSAQPGIVLSV